MKAVTGKRRIEWYVWFSAAFCLLVVGILLLPRIWMRPAPAGMTLTNTTKPVVGASGDRIDGKSYCDQGIFLLSRSNTRMRFFEYETGKTYVMCGESSCLHSGSDCPAWYDYMHPTQGLAAYRGSIYALIWNDARSAYELCSMQFDGTGRTALAALPNSVITLSNGSVTKSTVSDVVYSGGHAWITVSEPREIEAIQDGILHLWNFSRHYGVDLSSGHIFELKVPVDDSYGNQVWFETATDDELILCAEEKEPMLSEAEFTEACGRGEYKDITVSEQFPDRYDAYRYYWEQDVGFKYTYYRYDIGSGELTELESGTCTHGWSIPPHMFLGEYDGWLYVEDTTDEYKTIDSDPLYKWDRQNRNFLWNLETGEQKDLFRGPVPMTSQYGDMTGHITSEGLIFYRKYLEDKQVETYAYSLETGESRYLYTYNFDDGVPFELYSETPTQFIGCYRDKLCVIDKEDYMNGDFEKSRELVIP